MKNTVFLNLVVSFVFLVSCKTDAFFIPEKHPDLSEERYIYFINKYKEAYKNNDYYLIAFQLSNLKYKGDLTFNYLKKSIEENCYICDEIYNNILISKSDGFYQSIFKNDTTIYLRAFKLCLDKIGPDSYDKYVEDYNINSFTVNKSCITAVDSIKWDQNLIKFLKNIKEADQYDRRKSMNKYLSKKEIINYDRLILRTDSINLCKLDSLFSKQGFPSFNKISPDQHQTVFLVLHHQSDINIRKKYRGVIENNYPKNLLELYDRYKSN